MLTRSMMAALAVGFLAAGCVTEEQAKEEMTETAEAYTSGSWECKNLVGAVTCNHIFLPITVDIKNVDVLSDNELSVLEGSLNNLNILNILNHSKILNDVEATVLKDFLNFGEINITKNNVLVCVVVNLLGKVCQ